MRSNRRTLLIACGLVLGAGLALSRLAPAAPEDDAALVRERCKAFVAAWNAHDPKSMSATFSSDGDLLDASGRRAAGREAVEAQFAADHTGTGALRASVLEVKDEPIRFVTPEVAISDATVEVSGALNADGKPEPAIAMHVTNVWRKANGEWWVIASRPYVRAPDAKEGAKR